MEWARGHDIPFAPVNTLPEVLDDPHFRQRGMVMTDKRGWDHIGSPIRFADEPGCVRFDLPALGQHTQALLRDIGYAEEAIARLENGGIIRQASPEEIARHAGADEIASAPAP